MHTNNNMMPPLIKPSECDVLVIGGGPAGSTAATLLAERGYKVTLLEKAHHPRFHIGESLLPANLPLLEKLGVADAVRAIGMEKWGARFVSPVHAHEQTIEFADAWDKSMPMSYQVRRSEFDEILIRNAAQKNADVIEGCQVKEVVFLSDSKGALVQARHDDGRLESWNTRFVLDASGRDTFLGNRLKMKNSSKKHNSTAIYAHFTGAKRDVGKQEGDITIFWFAHGWFWFIPLTNGLTSIGAVTWPYYLKTRAQKPLDDFFEENIQWFLRTRFQVIRPGHGTDAGQTIRQRNKPKPAMLKPKNSDVAFLFPLIALGTGKVRIDRRAVVFLVAILYFQTITEKGIASRRVKHKAGVPGLQPPVVVPRLHQCTL